MILKPQVKQATLQCYARRSAGHFASSTKRSRRSSLPKCVASSGTPEKIRHGLVCAGFLHRLAPHIFSATQVERGKPAPDLFLFAAAQMQACPSDAW